MMHRLHCNHPLLIIVIAFSIIIVNDALKCRGSDNSAAREQFRLDILKRHNDLRWELAHGKVSGNDGPLPPAMDMHKLIYDCKLEAIAREWTSQCKNDFSPNENVGENIYSIKSETTETSDQTALLRKIANDSIDDWWEESKNMMHFPEALFNRTVAFWGTHHFTQAGWARSVRLGCYTNYCPNFTIVSCNYSPAGNILGTKMYSVGDPCTTDANCGDTQISKCLINEGLCTEESLQCDGSDNSLERQQFRLNILDKHNRLRRDLAAGTLSRKHGDKPLPPAMDMHKLKYSCKLEAIARNQTSHCDSKYSSNVAGENFFYLANPNGNDGNQNALLRQIVDYSVDYWWGKSMMWLNLTKVKSHKTVYNDGVDYNFALLAYARTKYLGCYTRICPHFTVINCQYLPPGRFFGTKMYSVGDPCTTDANCGNTEISKCLINEGLCIVKY